MALLWLAVLVMSVCLLCSEKGRTSTECGVWLGNLRSSQTPLRPREVVQRLARAVPPPTNGITLSRASRGAACDVVEVLEHEQPSPPAVLNHHPGAELSPTCGTSSWAGRGNHGGCRLPRVPRKLRPGSPHPRPRACDCLWRWGLYRWNLG